MMGLVADIQRFSVHDGPGIRTTVFLKGCNFRCPWCHNPEPITPRPAIKVFTARCIGCGACLNVCPEGARTREGEAIRYDRGRCRACGRCARACCSGAIALVGRRMEPGEVLAEVMEDAPYYWNSGGGVTISGGEPLCQPEFSREILRNAKEAGIHTALETNLSAPWEVVESLVPWTDFFMVDVKLADPERHLRRGLLCQPDRG